VNEELTAASKKWLNAGGTVLWEYADPVYCTKCGKQVAKHLEGLGWFECPSCTTRFMVDRRKPVEVAP
jgi:DNA-directed RNA polymerase subunit RPC12/RpoP